MSISARPYLQEVSIRSDTDIDFDTYPFSIPAVKELNFLKFHSDVTFFVGENGAGKSTILEAIAVAMGFGPEGGTKDYQLFRTTDSVSMLHESLKLSKSFKKPRDSYFLRAESFFNIATYMEDIGSVSPSFHKCSHGEAFMRVLTEKFWGNGLYLLDEPEAALSPNRQLAALSAIHQLVQKESQFIIATHSPILLSYPNAKILQFDETGITEVAYEDTEHFGVTRDFLNHYLKRLQQLFSDE
jgi:predicted ATPase